ncbi:MAG: winged helix-turn-helix domain-containing protein [Fimbriimonadaceae bacterium]
MVAIVANLHRFFDRIDDAFQSKVRVGIISALVGAGSLDFKTLRENLELTDGNLSSHLAHLERRGFIAVRKSFLGKRPHTEVELTDEGLLGFRQYIDALEKIVAAAKERDA